MPLTIDGLTGSCVKVPCTFGFDSQFDRDLDDSCKAIWIRGSTAGTSVFDSSLTGDQASGNILQGNLTGNLQNKECTTIFYNMPPPPYDNYYFRIEFTGPTYHNSIYTGVSPKETKIIIEPKGPLLEGSSVSLLCKSRANPPVTNYTWYKGDEEEKEAGSSLVLNNVKPSSSGDYYCAAENEHGDQNSTLIRLDIQCKFFSQYGTQNSSITQIDETTIIIQPKGPLLEGCSVSLLCKSRANPPVTNYTWYKGDEEEKEAGSSLVLNDVKPSSSGDYYCAAENEHGDQNSTLIRLDIQCKLIFTILSSSRCIKISSMIRCSCYSQGNPPPSLVWKLAGEPVNHSAAIPIRESLRNVGMKSIITLYDLDEDTLSLINSSKVDVIYANKAFLEEKDVAEEEVLHYVNVDFAKLQAHSKGKPGEGEIRALDSKTEYAEIHLQSRGSNGGDAEEEENVSDIQLEQKKTA
ncbi:hypothetical protein F7725_018194 [Dissostichus mawsoni]|uniref:Ig-like domain-containing protein n=1 Tax=Dissostichus mawsoni TaxID=36200 RepID=A0A7J5XSE0_DISMA|nr:hypothetical protein F7725_018194 [Dissostichus mawsoni]